MTRKPETRLVHQIQEALEREFPGSYFRKIHGNPYQHAGIPDLVGCVQGWFVGLEVKTDTGKTSKIQILEGIAIERANGIHGVVRDPDDAIRLINSAINSTVTPRSI